MSRFIYGSLEGTNGIDTPHTRAKDYRLLYIISMPFWLIIHLGQDFSMDSAPLEPCQGPLAADR